VFIISTSEFPLHGAGGWLKSRPGQFHPQEKSPEEFLDRKLGEPHSDWTCEENHFDAGWQSNDDNSIFRAVV
jgi:hypothetical protein